jgi:hypothetical protein
MPATPSGPTRAVAESIRVQLGTDALVLITPGPRLCAVVIASVPGYPSRITDARTELDSEPVKAREIERIAYSVPETARALGTPVPSFRAALFSGTTPRHSCILWCPQLRSSVDATCRSAACLS